MLVSNFRNEMNDGVARAVADVDGIPLWFESADVKLVAAPEAYGSALLLPSQHRRRRLVLDAPVSREWFANITGVLSIWGKWWGYHGLSPICALSDENGAEASTATGLCFSGGVDSFHSLVSDSRPNFLIAIQGFDIPLADEVRMNGLRRSLTAAASFVGATPVVVRTNLREHPASGRPHLWERSHGGALAAVGHVLSSTIGKLLISSTYSINRNRKWGSSVQTDHLFSSSVMSIVHFGTAPREEKIRSISMLPLAREHLRVCWENRTVQGNCSRCAKCTLVMLHLAEYGVLEEFRVFDGKDELASRLDSIPYLRTHVAVLERAVARRRLEPRLQAAAARLLSRSQRAFHLNRLRNSLSSFADRYV